MKSNPQTRLSSLRAVIHRLAPPTLALALLCSCASSERMMRISPFAENYYDGKKDTAITMAENRKNYWPFFYENAGTTSILWPMIDMDSRGMAVRPFFNLEGDEYSVLFPLVAWNPVNGDGWALLAYWDADNERYGCVPLFHVGKSFHYAGPVWWDDDAFGVLLSKFSSTLNFAGPFWIDFSEKEGASGGFFPLVQAGDPNVNWFFPLYFHEKTAKSELHNALFNLLARIKTFNNGDNEYWILPYYHEKSGTQTSDFVVPLFFNVTDEKRDYRFTFAFPFMRIANQGDHVYAFMPLAMFNFNEAKKKRLYFVFPWMYSKKDGERTDAFFPLYLVSSGEKTNSVFTPIFSYETEDDKLNFFNILALIYNYARVEEKHSHNIVWPLLHFAYPDFQFRFFPLINYHDDALGVIDVDKNGFDVLGWLLFSCKHHAPRPWRSRIPFRFAEEFREKLISDFSKKPEHQSLSVRSLLLFSFTHDYYQALLPGARIQAMSAFKSKRDKRPKQLAERVEERDLELLLFSDSTERFKIWKEDAISIDDVRKIHVLIEKLNVLQLNARSRSKRPGNLPVPSNPDVAKTQLELKKLLVKNGIEVPGEPSYESLAKALVELDRRYTETARLDETSIPLLFRYQSLENDYRWNILLYLVQNEVIGDYERFEILKYFYRSERKGDSVARDIFPFIQYDHGPNKFKFSFLYRILNYENNAGDVNGHLFFIPF